LPHGKKPLEDERSAEKWPLKSTAPPTPKNSNINNKNRTESGTE